MSTADEGPAFEVEEDFEFTLIPSDTGKRRLRSEEIEYVLSVITPQRSIPLATAVSIMKNIKQPLREELERLEIYPVLIPELRREIEYNYESSKINSGDSIGITAAQSFGQFYTQSTLNTFHTAGLTVKTVVTGVGRFEEILNATTKPKSVSCTIRFRENNSSILELRNKTRASIVYFDIKKLTLSMKSSELKSEPDWYEGFELLYNNRFRNYRHFVTINLNLKILYEYLISIEDIAKCIEETYDDLVCVFSPLHIGVIHVYVDISLIEMPEDKIHFVTKENVTEVYMEEVVIPNLEKLHISGIKGVENAFFVQEKGKWHLETEGGKFDDVLAHPDVDMENTITNHIWDIYNTLGIEAARQHILEELTGIMPGISVYHSKFLVDYMTRNGTIISISRYTMRSEGSGALSKASFEETLDNLINAGLFGESENPNSVSTSIICGKLGAFGTGVCELKVDVSKLRSLVKEQVKEKSYG